MKIPGAAAAFGVRTRLVLAFLLVAAVSAATTAALTYREARSAVLERAQDTAVASFREEAERFVPGLPMDPEATRWALYDIAARSKPHPWIVFAEYGSLRVSSGDRPASGVLTADLRRSARTAPRGAFQRVVKDGDAYLTVGMPVMTRVVAGGRAVPSGLVLYAVMPMANEETDIDALVTAARDGALPGLAVALVPALFAARSVLRPVRELRRAAHSMGGGQLDTRIAVRGRDEMADLARTFNASAARLEHSVQELKDAGARARRFASDVSHELRTPLAGMLAVTDVLDEDAGRLDPDTARAVRLISAETGKLALLVEDLMEMSRFDARVAELNTDEVDAAEAVRRTLSGRRWHDRVVTELPEGIRIRLDPRRFDVIVANLVGNALRHGAEPVTVRLSPRADTLVAEVRDHGPGIADTALPHIFDRFYKADAARSRSSGSGLGLAITRENVRLHGGTIRAQNAPGGGALFTVELPYEGPASRETRPEDGPVRTEATA
ncbi:HAMP domain-containing sensor histidine kinase [Streptomyces sp. V2I9]|uniref:sensor histidine kinase n=1 Tax=Streptomyces sp. V2I9 TaxID=3042304 RepID=UPI002783E507|nr:HAMP domain-containing sensor histidine kinase [Streptomyces sp. V2I9]MDQ0988679.1 two-component system sensor histidine kinase MtrB [Streptomyces sp. V2I9]